MTLRTSYHIILAASAALLLALAAGCKSSQKAASAGDYDSSSEHTESRTAKPAARTLEGDFAAMAKAYTPWTDLTVPVKVSVQQPKKISVSGTLTMVYGEAMSLSLKMLFIEAATVYADRDSVLVVSKPLNTYFSESIERFTAQAGLSLADLQSLMLGQAFAPAKGTVKSSAASDFTLARADDITTDQFYAFTATPRKMPAGVSWHFTALAPVAADSPVAPQLFALDIAAGTNSVQCSFAQSEISPAGIIAAKMQIEGKVKKHNIDLIISGNPEKAQWNSGARPRKPSIPRGASRMSTAQVLKMLNRL